jgi:glycosyltransferase involved in cell wall biosynthesis
MPAELKSGTALSSQVSAEKLSLRIDPILKASSAPTVSVLIPVHNGERFLARTLESALRQSITDFEVIVLDDASSDGSMRTIEPFTDDPRLRVLRRSISRGAAGAWNELLHESAGDFVKLLPQDDVMYPNQLEREVRQFGLSTTAIAVFSGHRLIDERGRPFGPKSMGSRRLRGSVSRVDIAAAVLSGGGNPVGPPGTLTARRELAIRVGYSSDAGYVIDLDFVLRLSELGEMVAIDEVLHEFRVHSQSWSHAVRGQQVGDLLALHDGLRSEVLSTGRRIPAAAGARAKARSALRRMIYATAKARESMSGPRD